MMHKSVAGRRGFTLPELLIVMAIIAILMGLLINGVMKYLGLGPEMLARSDINGLNQAISSFNTEFGTTYIPSKIRLREEGGYNTADPLDRASVAFLTKMFGRRWDSNGKYDWNNDGTTKDPTIPANPAVWILTGDQCLVFFLGGIPSRASGGVDVCLGFAKNPADPVDVYQATDTPAPLASLLGTPRNPTNRVGPFFPFKSLRLVRRDYDAFATKTWGPASGGRGSFFSYKDPFKPDETNPDTRLYAYYSNYGSRNGYNKNRNTTPAYGDDCPNLADVTGTNSAPTWDTTTSKWVNNSLAGGPYFLSAAPLQYHAAESYQIISPGADGMYGPGGVASTGATNNTDTKDNMANFQGGKLAVIE